MKALILAAGVGRRLGEAAGGRPKALLTFGGKTLLRRHVELLAAAGVDEVVIGVGYRAAAIEVELARIGSEKPIRSVHNPRYREGSVVTLWTLRHELAFGGDVLLMDADVLYDRRILSRLLRSRHADCLLLDRGFEPGEEPVKVCLRDGAIVDFGKRVDAPFDDCGESVGFFRFGPAASRDLARAADAIVAGGRTDDMYEEAIRDLLLAGPPGRFGFEDVTGLPWIEIDFPDDVRRAEREILPRLADPPPADPSPAHPSMD